MKPCNPVRTRKAVAATGAASNSTRRRTGGRCRDRAGLCGPVIGGRPADRADQRGRRADRRGRLPRRSRSPYPAPRPSADRPGRHRRPESSPPPDPGPEATPARPAHQRPARRRAPRHARLLATACQKAAANRSEVSKPNSRAADREAREKPTGPVPSRSHRPAMITSSDSRRSSPYVDDSGRRASPAAFSSWQPHRCGPNSFWARGESVGSLCFDDS
jgi:hypothetical protein